MPVKRAQLPVAWIVPLVRPYLPGYIPVAEHGGPLAGYRFMAPAPEGVREGGRRRTSSPKKARPLTGIFVGYLLGTRGLSFLRAVPPECLVFWFVEPARGSLHHRLVDAPQGLARPLAQYIRWLTHRPPRFELFERESITLVRHDSMRTWPRRKYGHLSRNFFIETLAWLVRSGLVRDLPRRLASL